MLKSSTFLPVGEVKEKYEEIMKEYFKNRDKAVNSFLAYFEDTWVGVGNRKPIFPIELWNCHDAIFSDLPKTRTRQSTVSWLISSTRGLAWATGNLFSPLNCGIATIPSSAIYPTRVRKAQPDTLLFLEMLKKTCWQDIKITVKRRSISCEMPKTKPGGQIDAMRLPELDEAVIRICGPSLRICGFNVLSARRRVKNVTELQRSDPQRRNENQQLDRRFSQWICWFDKSEANHLELHSPVEKKQGEAEYNIV
ncbi:hypothetical protein DMENIID0001_037790 [Sergentomyia squamirostris]